MEKWRYEKGLQEIGDGAWAYLLPNGSWGWSNAGLIVDGEESLLVDTLFDERLTADMLAIMKDRHRHWGQGYHDPHQYPRQWRSYFRQPVGGEGGNHRLCRKRRRDE